MTGPAQVEVGRLTATYEESGALDRARGDRLLQRLAEVELERAFAGLALPGGLWCLRRVTVPIRLDLAASDLSLSRAWGEAVAAAVRHAMTTAHATDVAQYRSQREACLELVTHVAVGRSERAWAWRQLGLLDGEAHTTTPGPVIVRALAALDGPVLGLLVSAAEGCGVAALHRVLGAEGWASLVRLVAPGLAAEGVLDAGGLDADLPDADLLDGGPLDAGPLDAGPLDADHVPGDRSDGDHPGTHRGDTHRADTHRGRPHDAAQASGPPARTAGSSARGPRPAAPAARSARQPEEPVVETVLADSRFAVAARRSGLRPDRRTAAAWAVISLLEADPLAERRSRPTAVLAGLTQAFTGEKTGRSEGSAPRGLGAALPRNPSEPNRPVPALDTQDDGQAGRRESGAKSERDPGRAAPRPSSPSAAARSEDRARPQRSARTDPAATAGPELEDADGSELDTRGAVATAWAGLPFLLNTAAAAGLPETAGEGPLAGRGIRWVLHALAQRLAPAAADDPAALALAGLTPGDHPPGAAQPGPSEDEAARLEVLAGTWARATVERLLRARGATAERAGADALDLIEDLVSRPGVVVAEPGWIEVHLRLDGVRLDVRRAGLDLDPGWVPWLGAVVRFLYHDDLSWGYSR